MMNCIKCNNKACAVVMAKDSSLNRATNNVFLCKRHYLEWQDLAEWDLTNWIK